jgi:hypothetical protein
VKPLPIARKPFASCVRRHRGASIWTKSFRNSGPSRFLSVFLLFAVVGACACSTNEKEQATPDAAAEKASEQQTVPSPESIAKARKEMEDARRTLEEQVRREREDLPMRQNMLPGGKVRELAREEMAEVVQLCRAAPRRFVEAEVELDTEGQVQSIEVRTGSGEQGCDQAVTRALQASSWASCQELGEPAPCLVSYALSLGSPLH